MRLDVNSRAKLASKLLTSLEDLSEDEIEKLWAEEALRRDEELNKGKVKLIDADVVFKSARARLK
jgi:hypothetical protein